MSKQRGGTLLVHSPLSRADKGVDCETLSARRKGVGEERRQLSGRRGCLGGSVRNKYAVRDTSPTTLGLAADTQATKSPLRSCAGSSIGYLYKGVQNDRQAAALVLATQMAASGKKKADLLLESLFPLLATVYISLFCTCLLGSRGSAGGLTWHPSPDGQGLLTTERRRGK